MYTIYHLDILYLKYAKRTVHDFVFSPFIMPITMFTI